MAKKLTLMAAVQSSRRLPQGRPACGKEQTGAQAWESTPPPVAAAPSAQHTLGWPGRTGADSLGLCLTRACGTVHVFGAVRHRGTARLVGD